MALTRRGRLAVTLTATVVVVAGIAYLLTRTPFGSVLGLDVTPPCTLTAGDVTHEWTHEQAMTATTVAGVGTRIGASINGVAAAVVVGLRPEPEAAISPQAARVIYRELPDVARPEPADVRTAEALLGYDGAALSCVLPVTGRDLAREDPARLGLTARAETLRLGMRAVFGKQVLGGFEPQGVTSGHIEGSAHYEGRAIDVFFRPVTAANQQLGRQQAMWSVAHAERLHLATVIFDRQIWTASRSLQGWRDYRHPDGATENPVLLHEDHVHVDVVEDG